MPIPILFAGIQRSKAISFAVAASFALMISALEIDDEHVGHGDDLQMAQVKAKGKGKGAGFTASKKGEHKGQENAASGEDEEVEGEGGKRCPAGQSQAPLRGRGGSASVRGAGCL